MLCATTEFDIASVKLSEHQSGPDYNNQLAHSPAGLTARNVTLRRLVAEAYGLQLRQVVGPAWLDQDEYDVEARAAHSTGRKELDTMLRTLLAQRFGLNDYRLEAGRINTTESRRGTAEAVLKVSG